jgi:hypothetical protein
MHCEAVQPLCQVADLLSPYPAVFDNAGVHGKLFAECSIFRRPARNVKQKSALLSLLDAHSKTGCVSLTTVPNRWEGCILIINNVHASNISNAFF